jgi:hypothetical protein
MVIKSARRIAARAACILLVTAGAVAASPAAAQANPPTITKNGPDVEDFVDTSCGFDVAVHASFLGAIDILKVDAAGNFQDISELQLAVEVLTNIQTGKTIRLNTSGGGKFTGNVNADGFTITGAGNWGWPRNPANPSQLGLFFSNGHFVETVDSQGVITVQHPPQHIRDLCVELAG